MPYLRITGPDVDASRRRAIAASLTDAVVELWYDRRAPLTKDELRERTTIHFAPYGSDELFIGARTPDERGVSDVTVELSDWGMTPRRQRRVARLLTPLLATLFGVAPDAVDNVNIRFHPYPPTDFAVGGRLLSDRIPLIGRVMKTLAG